VLGSIVQFGVEEGVEELSGEQEKILAIFLEVEGEQLDSEQEEVVVERLIVSTRHQLMVTQEATVQMALCDLLLLFKLSYKLTYNFVN
jgi:hypothetical protein